jgi:Tol biopolymer transport system component
VARLARALTLALLVGVLSAGPAASQQEAKPIGRIAYAPRIFPKKTTDNWEIYAVSPSGGRSINLTRGGCNEGQPAWSHDGLAIAFTCLPHPHTTIDVMSRDRRSRRTILEIRRGLVGGLAWSPDDRRLAFAGGGIKVVNADGTGLRRVTHGPDGSPSWSADGRTIVFGRRGQIFRVRADGTGLRRLARGSRPQLSPDGRTIAYLGGHGGVWLMDADGSRRRRLHRAGDANEAVAWSPDGRFLAYQFQHSEIYVIAVDGTRPRLLPTQGSDFSGIDWGPDLAT